MVITRLNNETKVQRLHTKQVGKNIYMVDLKTGGFEHLICSYIIMGEKPFLVESGPASSVPNLLSGLKELNIRFEDAQYRRRHPYPP